MFLRRNMKVHLFLTFLATTSAFSVSYLPQSRGNSAGRRLFGGYRIAPKICRATNPSRIESTEPPICMFNHECKLQNGDVVGACMDGFLFGACCQLPAKRPGTVSEDESISSIGNLENVYEVDHVPEIPILLNPDGTPMEIMPVPSSDKPSIATDRVTTPGNSPLDIKLNSTNTNVKTSINEATSSTMHYADKTSNSEKVQFPQVDVSHLESDFPALLNQQSILDDLRLPGLLSHHTESNDNDIHDQQDSSSVNPVTTFLNPDQVLQIADPVDQLPVLFSQGIGQNNYSSVDTILLNENGTVLDENNNPDDLFLPGTYASSSTNAQASKQPLTTFTTQGIEKVTQKIVSLTQQMATATEKTSAQTVSIMSEESTVTQQQSPSVTYELYSLPPSTVDPTAKPLETTEPTSYETDTPSELSTTPLDLEHSVAANTEMSDKVTKYIPTLQSETTTPLSPSLSTEPEKLVKVPTISHEASSENKKHDVLNQEENSINHIISLLDDNNPSPRPEPFPQPEPNPHPDPNDENSGIQTWASVDGTTVRIPEIKVPVTRPTTTAATFPYTYYKPDQGSIYYDYEVTKTEAPIVVNTYGVPLNTYSPMTSEQGSYLTSPSTQNIYTNRPSSNPPAPTVIVLGPLGTEYTTKISQNTPVRRPVVSATTANITKNPSFSTTVTHNVNTVISTNNAFANQTKIVSTSYISVDLKDGTTSTKPVTVSEVVPVMSENVGSVTEEIGTAEPVATVYEEIRTKRPPTSAPTPSTWPSKPTFYLKPYTSRPSTEGTSPSWLLPTTTILLNNDPVIATTTLEEETLAPADLSNFPPVRNPNLNMSIPGSQQEKPTILETYNHTYYPDLQVIDEDDIPTPAFIEDDVLKNKVDGFVNKIVSSLQENFDDLKDVVYKKKTTITTTTSTPTRPSVTKRPATVGTGSTTRKPTRKPPTSTSQTTTRTPTPTKRPPLRTSSTTPKTVSSSAKPTRPVKVSSPKPRPTVQTTSSTKPPQTITKRPKPSKKPTTTVTTAASIADDSEVTPFSSTHIPTTSHIPDFRTECGVRPLVKTGRIVGGKGAKFGEWPWQVLVREATWLGLFTKNKCGGVLITNKYVITAAHCQPGFLASLVAVFGEFDISGDLEPKRSISRNVRRVIVHRNYNAATFENDLALLELETPVQFDAHIVPICMPDDRADFTGRMATVTGWGRLKYNGGVPSVLQEVQVPIIENSVCQEMFQTTSHSKLILDSFLCAGYANGQKDSCEGDSGGPLMLERPDGRWELVGTVSHGIKCAAPYLPGVYMRTTYFKPWLHSVTGV